MFDLNEHPHRRYNPLTREWVLVSPHRTKRPWQGQVERPPQEELPAYDPQCYLCPGNGRAGGKLNPQYTATFVFDNDYAALLPDTPAGRFEEDGLLLAEAEQGVCRVICFSPRHDLTVARMDAAAIRKVVDVWAEQYAEIGRLPFVNCVQIFENRGAMMGCSNPHPHCQLWSTSSLPNEISKEQAAQREYYQRRGVTLLGEYLERELALKERIVLANDHFVALVPFWALWPFETMLISRRQVAAMDELTEAERGALADAMKRLTTKYDNLFQVSFPYSMGFHQRPSDGGEHPEWRFHAHYYPPLLRSATVKKFMVGYELLAAPQRDITAEVAAARLREMSERHYTVA